MIKWIIIPLLFAYSINAQDTLYVIAPYDQTVIDKIEYEIIENIVSLYNHKNTKKFVIKNDTVPIFSDLLKKITQTKVLNSLAIGSISITPDRLKRLQFSSPYLPARDVLFSLKSHHGDITQPNMIVGFEHGTTQEELCNTLAKLYTFIKQSYPEHFSKMDALISGHIDFAISDNIDVWTHSNLKIIKELRNSKFPGFGIAYPLNSPVPKQLEKFLRYYLSSAKFYTTIERHYSKEVSDYFVRELKLKR